MRTQFSMRNNQYECAMRPAMAPEGPGQQEPLLHRPPLRLCQIRGLPVFVARQADPPAVVLRRGGAWFYSGRGRTDTTSPTQIQGTLRGPSVGSLCPKELKTEDKKRWGPARRHLMGPEPLLPTDRVTQLPAPKITLGISLEEE